jgi:hypothetical protein
MQYAARSFQTQQNDGVTASAELLRSPNATAALDESECGERRDSGGGYRRSGCECCGEPQGLSVGEAGGVIA